VNRAVVVGSARGNQSLNQRDRGRKAAVPLSVSDAARSPSKLDSGAIRPAAGATPQSRWPVQADARRVVTLSLEAVAPKRRDKPEIYSRRLSIARELTTWAGAMPRLIRRINEVLKLSDITETQAIDIELIAVAGRDGVEWPSGKRPMPMQATRD